VSNAAQSAMFLPANWNGRLILCAHGFIDPAAPIALPDVEPVDVAPWVVELRETLLSQGYAVAYSSYSENGWAVQDGAARTHELRDLHSIVRCADTSLRHGPVARGPHHGLPRGELPRRVSRRAAAVRATRRRARRDRLHRQRSGALRLLLSRCDSGRRPARSGHGVLGEQSDRQSHRRRHPGEPTLRGGARRRGSGQGAVHDAQPADPLDRARARLQHPRHQRYPRARGRPITVWQRRAFVHAAGAARSLPERGSRTVLGPGRRYRLPRELLPDAWRSRDSAADAAHDA